MIDKNETLTVIAEQLTRIADMMQRDARRHEPVIHWNPRPGDLGRMSMEVAQAAMAAEDKPTPIAEEPPCSACHGGGERFSLEENRIEAAHRAAKAAGLVAIKPSPGSSPSSYRRAADALEYNPSPYHLDCAAESYRAIADAIESQEEIG